MRGKHWLMILFTVLYFGTWVGFGYWYRSYAQSSHGTDFSFVSDILTKSRIATFKQDAHTQVDDGYIQAVLDSGGFGYPCNDLHTDEDLPMIPVTICVRPMGLAWALYYSQRLQEQHFAHYNIESTSKTTPPEELTGSYPILSVSRGSGPVKVTIFPQPNLDLTSCCYIERMVVSGAAGSKTLRLLTPARIEPGDGEIADTSDFVTKVAQSYRYLDSDIDLLSRIVDYPTQYPLADFLYFSAVTISTLGYGDILPNSQDVRILVMVETLLGALFFGGFLSAAFMA